MNNSIDSNAVEVTDEALSKVTTYDQLLRERVRLERLIENQKNIIRHDFDELKAEFKKEIKPAIETASFIKKITKPETRYETVFSLGTNVAIDLLLTRALRGSNLLVQLFLPKVLKNYTSHFLSRFRGKPQLSMNGKGSKADFRN